MAKAGAYCCDDMKRNVEQTCDLHPNRFDCPDCLIEYLPKFREYGIIVHDGGESICTITFCPWCGKKLPDSLRDLWFKSIWDLGLEPGGSRIPADLTNDAWWKARPEL